MFPRARLLRIGVAVAATLVGLGVVLLVGVLGFYNVTYALGIRGLLEMGLGVTLRFMAVVVPLGFSVGFLMGWARTSGSLALRGVAATYVEFFRSMPPIVLIFFSSLIVALAVQRIFFVEEPSAYAIAAAVVALGLHSSAYQAEIVRAGILSVPTGQHEAAEAVGLTSWQTMLRITLPQAFRVSLPALGNEFASVIKDTSLISVIGALELSYRAGLLVPAAIGQDFNLVFIIWTEVALFYFFTTLVVTRVVRMIEDGFKVPGLEAAQL